MASRFADKSIGEHDWHSQEYVDEWIARDVTRDEIRRPLLRQMLGGTPFSREAEISVLDVGAGHGLLSEEVLKAFPRAHLTLQDYSEPMFEHARQRLAVLGANVSYVRADLRDPAWTARVGGPFDLTVSGLAIHNLGIESLMKGCYRSICSLLRPGGLLLDYDLFGLVPGGVGIHTRWLLEAGFERVECTWEEAPLAILVASVGTK
jgi:SAM-dependent methyltransferase